MNPVRKNWCITWTLLFAVAACTNAFAFESDRTIGQFVHTSWGEKEGAPQPILTIAQTKDGYLWLGTLQGLFRFDGITFERYAPQTGPALPTLVVYSLLPLSNGDLWIGFVGTISRLRNGSVENYAAGEGVPNGRVKSLAQDREGTIWAGTDTGLARFEGGRWKEVGREWNFTGKSASALLVDSKGTLWAAADNTLVFLPQRSRIFQSTSIFGGRIGRLVEAPNGQLWMVEPTRSTRPVPLGAKPTSHTVEIRVGSGAILFPRKGDLWITTLGDGLRRAPVPKQLRGSLETSSSIFERFTKKDGLTDDMVLSIFQDREGNIWVGTQSGLDQFRMGNLVPVSLPWWYPNPLLAPGNSGDIWAFVGPRTFHVGTSIDELRSVPDRDMLTASHGTDGVRWLISWFTLIRLVNGRFSHFPLPQELPKPFIEVVRTAEDRYGVLWMAVQREGLFRRENGTWSRFDAAPELSKLMPTAAYKDSQGRAWFGYNEGTILYLEGGKIQIVSASQRSPVGSVAVIESHKQHVWVGGSSGMALFDGDRFRKVVPADLASFGRVSGIKELDDGSLWLCEERGVIHIAAPEVRKFLESTSYGVHYEVFDSRDGLPGKFQFSKNAGPNVVEGSDGRLWFTGGHGLAWLNPAAFSSNVLPPISISSFTADGKRFALQPDPTLPPRSQNLHLKYTALNLSSPEQVRYRYKLDGVDKDWQDAGVRREAFYNNLGPGKYKFHITARNEGGEWNAEEAVLDFRIAPAWFQTIWFRSFCICVFLFLLWTLYQLRLKQLERQFNRTLEARVAERTRIARELHDTLLQTFSASLLRFQSVSKMLPTRPEDAKQRVDSAIEQASNAIAEGRDAVHELRSEGPAGDDLAQAIGNFGKELLSGATGENPPEFRVHVEGTPRSLNHMVRDEAYRIAVEALRNAIRYAGARQIEAEIQYDAQQLRLRIRDDGKGIGSRVLEQGRAPGHWGLRGMRERAKLLGGNFEVWSEVGSGTEVELTVPAATAYAKPASPWSVFSRNWGSKRP